MSFVYLDTSVALAQVLTEDKTPPEELWTETLISSRLLEYEIWTRIHSRKLEKSHGDEVRRLLARMALVELISPILERAKEPFPLPVRTLDALHLASAAFLIENGQKIRIATYDGRMLDAARSMKIPVYQL